jgi:hypothetical protein
VFDNPSPSRTAQTIASPGPLWNNHSTTTIGKNYVRSLDGVIGSSVFYFFICLSFRYSLSRSIGLRLLPRLLALFCHCLFCFSFSVQYLGILKVVKEGLLIPMNPLVLVGFGVGVSGGLPDCRPMMPRKLGPTLFCPSYYFE